VRAGDVPELPAARAKAASKAKVSEQEGEEAGGAGRTELLDRDEERMVEARDEGTHAERPALDEVEQAAADGLGRPLLGASERAGVLEPLVQSSELDRHLAVGSARLNVSLRALKMS